MTQASAKDGRTRKDLRLDFYNQMTPITRIQSDVYATFDVDEVDIDYETSTVEGLEATLYERIEIVVEGRGKIIGEPNGSAVKEDVAFNVDPQEVIDSLYAEAQSMGADAVMNFRTEPVREDLDNGPTRSGVRARGFAIDRVDQ